MDIPNTYASAFKSMEIRSFIEPSLVSVIIPVYNGANNLLFLLNALKAQTYPQEALQIIVSDNNSSDGSDRVAMQYPGVQVVYERQVQNAGAARNRAISVARGDIFAFTDADCLPKSDWIEQGVKDLQKYNVDRLAGCIEFFPISPQSSACSLLDALYNLNQKFVVESFQAAVTANLFVKSYTFKNVGLFPTNDFLNADCEDIQWNRRASNAGFSLAYSDAPVIQHPPRSFFIALWEKGQRSGRGIFSLCHSEQRGGWLGTRHLLRMGRMLLLPRSLHWERLPFESQKIPLTKRIQIQCLKWLMINIAETWGYGQWFVRSMIVSQFKQE